MPQSNLFLPSTSLRCSYERARSVDHDRQILECSDLLSHPELLAIELLDAVAVIESFGESELDLVCNLERRDPNQDSAELVLDHFYEGQEVYVTPCVGPEFAFRCLATDVRPVPELQPSATGVRDGFDYIAEDTAGSATAILGVAQSVDDSSAYPLLLRLLSALTELVPATQLNVVNTDRLKGALAPDTCFDLHMVLWEDEGRDAEESAKIATLTELARDLAEVARNCLASQPLLASRVGRVHCLRMNPSHFEGRLEEVWRI